MPNDCPSSLWTSLAAWLAPLRRLVGHSQQTHAVTTTTTFDWPPPPSWMALIALWFERISLHKAWVATESSVGKVVHVCFTIVVDGSEQSLCVAREAIDLVHLALLLEQRTSGVSTTGIMKRAFEREGEARGFFLAGCKFKSHFRLHVKRSSQCQNLKEQLSDFFISGLDKNLSWNPVGLQSRLIQVMFVVGTRYDSTSVDPDKALLADAVELALALHAQPEPPFFDAASLATSKGPSQLMHLPLTNSRLVCLLKSHPVIDKELVDAGEVLRNVPDDMYQYSIEIDWASNNSGPLFELVSIGHIPEMA